MAESKGLWAVVRAGNDKFIARLVDYKDDQQDQAEKDFDAEKSFKLCPAYDFMSPFRPVQGPQGQVGMSRDPIVTQWDFTTKGVPLRARLTHVAFLNDFSDEDRRMYEAFIENCEKSMQQQRAGRAGLVLAGGSIPKGPNGAGR